MHVILWDPSRPSAMLMVSVHAKRESLTDAVTSVRKTNMTLEEVVLVSYCSEHYTHLCIYIMYVSILYVVQCDMTHLFLVLPAIGRVCSKI